MSSTISGGIPPTFSVSDRESGTLRVWSGALRGRFDCDKLKHAIPFKRHCIHGHMDREIWSPRPSEQVPSILKSVAVEAAKVVGHELAGRNYANYYQNGTSHTFSHRDFDCNPGDVVTLICFGAERMLAWGDCRQAAKNNKDCGKEDGTKHCLIPLCDGSIVQFDGLWNILHYHKVLKDTLSDDIGPRVSIQWFESRDLSKWSEEEQALWHTHEPNQNHVKRLKRNMVKELETKATRKEQLQCYIPTQFTVQQEKSKSCSRDEHSSKRLKRSE